MSARRNLEGKRVPQPWPLWVRLLVSGLIAVMLIAMLQPFVQAEFAVAVKHHLL